MKMTDEGIKMTGQKFKNKVVKFNVICMFMNMLATNILKSDTLIHFLRTLGSAH